MPRMGMAVVHTDRRRTTFLDGEICTAQTFYYCAQPFEPEEEVQARLKDIELGAYLYFLSFRFDGEGTSPERLAGRVPVMVLRRDWTEIPRPEHNGRTFTARFWFATVERTACDAAVTPEYSGSSYIAGGADEA